MAAFPPRTTRATMRVRALLAVAVSVTAAASLGGCTEEASSAEAPADASTESSRPAPVPRPSQDAEPDADTCTDLELGDAPAVRPIRPEESDGGDGGDAGLPTLGGGEIVDGTYVLESSLLLRGNPERAPVLREVFRFAGLRVEVVSEQSAGSKAVVTRLGSVLTTSGNRYVHHPTCVFPPQRGDFADGTYEATPDALTLEFSTPDFAIRARYRRRL